MKVYRQWVPCKRNALYNFIPIFIQLCTSVFHGLKMCMWSGFNPAVNVCHFSTLLTVIFFAGATSTSPKFDLYFLIGTASRALPKLINLVNCSGCFIIPAKALIVKLGT